MKILLLGEYSNVHATLATGLRELGHDVTVMSNGDFWKDYPRDIDISRKPGKTGGIRLMWRLLSLLPRMRGYDVVQLISPMFLELKIQHIRFFYRYIRRHNRRVFLGGNGTDTYYIKACLELKAFRYSDFNLGDTVREDRDAMAARAEWIGTYREKAFAHMAATCDGIIAGLYEYWVGYHHYFPEKSCFIPYPIIVPATTGNIEHDMSLPLRVFIGINRSRNEYKGTNVMLSAAQAVARKYPGRIILSVAESVPFARYEQMIAENDVLLDQLYSYTPAMNALMAMSKGVIVVGGGEEENYIILNENNLRPIINVQPSYESVYDALEELVIHPERISSLKRQSVEYIRRYHDYLKVAQQYLDFWSKK